MGKGPGTGSGRHRGLMDEQAVGKARALDLAASKPPLHSLQGIPTCQEGTVMESLPSMLEALG